MKNDFEKFHKEAQKYLDENAKGTESEEELKKLLDRFVKDYNAGIKAGANIISEPKTADDYLELASEAPTRQKEQYYLAKALELEPENLDALLYDAVSRSGNIEEELVNLRKVIAIGEEQMKKQGYDDEESIGDYWLIFQTRPYMRVLGQYLESLLTAGKYREGLKICRKMLHLCEGDNLGIRYTYVATLAALEEVKEAEEFFEKQEYEESMILLAMMILYYKVDDLSKAKEMYQRLKKRNPDTKKFFKAVHKGNLEKYEEKMNEYGYRPNTIEELLVFVKEQSHLLFTAPAFFNWAYRLSK
ncbi:MAG: hypothetical protein IJI66_01250 [Erysipelotrichaceae bacterium]|nr:hypothetical protein [Erysipelotrichaceae bacterium]